VAELMGLTKASFVAFLFVIALVAVAGCIRLLPRYSGPGRAQVAARAGLLVGSQVLVVVALLALVNSDMQFYSSWNDLFGADSGTVRVSDQSPGAQPPPAVPSAKLSEDGLTRRLPAGEGRLRVLELRGSRSGLATRAYVYLPPQYTHDQSQRFPVALFLAPPRDAIVRQRLPELAAREIAAGRLRPTLIVIAPTGPGCVDAPGGKQGETFLSEDLPAAIDTAYRVGTAPSSWSVAGPGTRGPAGYCAALLAMRHSDQFGSAVFAAPALIPPPGELYGGSRSIRDEYDPRWRLHHRPPPPISVGVIADDGFAAGARPPMHAQPLPATAAQNIPAILRWLSAHLTPGSRP
jgi:hypothetical protein